MRYYQILLIFCLILFLPACSKIDPEKIYQVYDVTVSSGKTYRNLKHFNDNHNFIDYYGNTYYFNGNYTVITRKVSGKEFLKEVLKVEEEKNEF